MKTETSNPGTRKTNPAEALIAKTILIVLGIGAVLWFAQYLYYNNDAFKDLEREKERTKYLNRQPGYWD